MAAALFSTSLSPHFLTLSSPKPAVIVASAFLPFSAQLTGLFEQAGSVEMVEVVYDRMTGRGRGFGFVKMSSAEEAGAAVEQFNGYTKIRCISIKGRPLRVTSGPPSPRDDSAPRAPRGAGACAKVIYDRESGRSRGFGFVTYGSAEEVNNAISNLDGIIRVTVAESKPRREF
ncbi:hypothetical protein SETIT_4G088800v2 [Setaria italica]|uniref:RRM domain-containing protein n=1 Tax=Setaria italica TaxID=4555 RepID=A0A368QSI2_SETIT|nr:hypothetical protein SETIT_4G088800v2 [Setaria italica]